MGCDWQSDAWRDGYDEWKTRLPDSWDEDLEGEKEREYERKTSRRRFLIDEAYRRSEVNHARNSALELRRANDLLRGIRRYPRNAAAAKFHARSGIAEARRLRTLVGPMYPFDLMPF